MRSFISSSGLLCTLLWMANLSSALNQADVDAIWEEARTIYQATLFHNGATTPARRSIKMTAESKIMSENSNIYPVFEKLVMERYHLTKRQAGNMNTPAACRIPGMNCDGAATSRYRNFDGTCNNLKNPLWGTVNRPFNRVVPDAYEDRIGDPRGRRVDPYLPNARSISTKVHFDADPVNPSATNMVPQFGQFLDHDITMTPEKGAENDCCANPNVDVDCWSIQIPSNDPFYSNLRPPQRCLTFTRSTTCVSSGVREQINGKTAYIDLSHVYGSERDRTQALRSFRGGRLATNPQLANYLPTAQQRNIQGVPGDFVAGDDRINIMPGLAVMHNLFLEEHNRIADDLRKATGRNDDDFLFQESRRLLIAIMQNIVYSEYLPIVLGDNAMGKYNLNIPASGNSQYDENTDATIFNSFATAAYRYGHSMIAGLVKLIAGNNREVGSYLIRDHYFVSSQITQSRGQGYHWILRGLMTQNAPEMDRFMTTGVTQFLFKQPDQAFGFDLASSNIHRGRDHGIADYSQFREYCGLSALTTSWNDKPAEVTDDGWDAVKDAYGSTGIDPFTIDLFVGGLIEKPADGGLTGPTFQCLMGQQFQRLKDGDRYFFTHNTGDYAFTSEQLEEIKKQKLSDIICRNSEQPDAPENAFLVSSSSNPMKSCSSHTPLNIRAFTTNLPPPTPSPPRPGGPTLHPIISPYVPDKVEPVIAPVVNPIANPILNPIFGSGKPKGQGKPKDITNQLSHMKLPTFG